MASATSTGSKGDSHQGAPSCNLAAAGFLHVASVSLAPRLKAGSRHICNAVRAVKPLLDELDTANLAIVVQVPGKQLLIPSLELVPCSDQRVCKQAAYLLRRRSSRAAKLGWILLTRLKMSESRSPWL